MITYPQGDRGRKVLMQWLKKAPTSVVVTVVIVCGLGLFAVLAGFVALTIADKPTDEYRQFINTLANLIMLPIGGLSAVAAVSAARSSSNTEDQTNGALTAKSAEIADAAVQRTVAHMNGDATHG
jgi:hypothetical protein